MKLFQRSINRIKNQHPVVFSKDFRYNIFSLMLLAPFIGGGVVLQYVLFPAVEFTPLALILTAGLGAVSLIALFPTWSTVFKIILLGWILMFAFLDTAYSPLVGFLSLGLIVSPSLQLIYQWDKAVILRAGKFLRVQNAGVFVLFPVLDRIAEFVDTRIRATDFSAEKTLTKDTVPVHVDALAFWMIWDAERAILEVEDFVEAVVLSAQTALRDSIGRHELADLLSEREKLGEEIQQVLDKKTNPWGITILSIEFTDIIIPPNLEDAMSKRAQAERERQSRVILGTAEVEIAEKFEAASNRYKENPTALQLRAMNMVYEGIRTNGSMMILPSSALDAMNLGTVMGAMALGKENASEEGESDDKS
jgi:regulator of protease activity HflC (stomatin/prohibitin superfamily)